MANSTHYAALGLGNHERNAVISSAYRDLSWRYHPARVGPGGERNFRPIADAYRVLSDSSLRRSYDDARARRDDAETPLEPEPLVSRKRPSTRGAARSTPVEVLSLRRESILASPAGEAVLARIARNFSGVGVPKSESTD